MAILLSKNITQCDDRARRPRGVATARRSVGLGLVEILSWMRHCPPPPNQYIPFVVLMQAIMSILYVNFQPSACVGPTVCLKCDNCTLWQATIYFFFQCSCHPGLIRDRSIFTCAHFVLCTSRKYQHIQNLDSNSPDQPHFVNNNSKENSFFK